MALRDVENQSKKHLLRFLLVSLPMVLACDRGGSNDKAEPASSSEGDGSASSETGSKTQNDDATSESTSMTMSDSEDEASAGVDDSSDTGESTDTGEGTDTGESTDTSEGTDTGEGTDTEDSDGSADERCSHPDLVWKTARKTNYTAYPDPDSPECQIFDCSWAGLFAGCSSKRPEAWVRDHDIAAVYPLFRDLVHHELCLRQGNQFLIVNVIDTCVNEDCDGCCERAQGTKDALIDLESYTNERWGLPDGSVEWADLGLRSAPICD